MMGISNDGRGWVMTILSGIACVLGASIICVDIIIRRFPGQENFRIQDSDSFLSLSLSLSFGVMLFSALYNMLPSSKRALQDGGFSPKEAAWILIACFLGGVVGIQILSRFLHHFMASNVVDCEHTHDQGSRKEDLHVHEPEHEHQQHHRDDHEERSPRPKHARKSSLPGHLHRVDSERRVPLRRSSHYQTTVSNSYSGPMENHSHDALLSAQARPEVPRRPTLQQRVTDKLSQLVSGREAGRGCDGTCYGYSAPCGQDCFKNITARGGYRTPSRTTNGTSQPTSLRSNTHISATTPLLHHLREAPRPSVPSSRLESDAGPDLDDFSTDLEQGHSDESSATAAAEADGHMALHKPDTNESTHPDVHHHHVPENAFLSIGLQTSIAIAIHKLPEGFITYATNHANPRLGVSVFLALFIHNITEGFAMALPLYLAINSRFRAMSISFVLGGLSQPLGAAVAAIWFRLAGDGDWAPSEGVYGGMFAVTAGIMASVALQLFSEALDLTHSRNLCMVGAFTGMSILGISSALTA